MQQASIGHGTSDLYAKVGRNDYKREKGLSALEILARDNRLLILGLALAFFMCRRCRGRRHGVRWTPRWTTGYYMGGKIMTELLNMEH